MTKQTDLFGDRDVRIPDNPSLEWMARLILRLTDAEKTLLDGNRMGDVDRQIRMAVWMEKGLADILTPDQVKAFTEWALDSKRCVDPELIRRARAWLIQHDYIRVSGAAMKSATQQGTRLAGSFGRK